MLGGLRVLQGEQVLSRFRTRKTAVLLAYLAYHLGQSHPREVLVEMLWPEGSLQAGRNSLNMALSSLRRQLEPPGTPPGTVLRADLISVALSSDTVTTDAAEFESALLAAEQAGTPTERMGFLEQAVALYRGELLPGYYEDWILHEQQRLSARYGQALRQLTALLEEAGDGNAALEYARRAAQEEPLLEEAQDALMRLYAALGRPGAALRQYREWERRLREEMGTSPSLLMQQLALEIGEREGRGSGRKREDLSAASIASALPLNVGALPTGTVTFLLVDVANPAGLTPLQEKTYRQVLRRTFQHHGGREVRQIGTAYTVVFGRPSDALEAAVAAQQSLAKAVWPEDGGVGHACIALDTREIKLKETPSERGLFQRDASLLRAAHGGQTLCTETTAALLRPVLEVGLRLEDQGLFRLPGEPSAERLFSVVCEGIPSQRFPPPNAEPAAASNLPLALTPFFGREAEIARLLDLLALASVGGGAGPVAPEPARLLTLTGPGGTGKTRLAIEIGRRLVGKFGGAVWLVPLAPVTEAERIPDTILSALGQPPPSFRTPLEQAVASLSSQLCLLILDNFEQLVPEGVFTVQSLLERVPSLQCLVTSRQCLNLPGEREFALAPLPVPDEVEMPEPLSRWPSAQLFVDRAQAVRPDFQITTQNAAQIAALCQKLEGIPLAIELAATRARIMGVAQMLSELDRRLDFLVSRQRGVEPRHQTLRATLDWSYRLLDPALQQLFRRLSVFRGGWSAEAANQVCGDWGQGTREWGPGTGQEPAAEADASNTGISPVPGPHSLVPVLDYLEALREASLVRMEEGIVGTRFRMLETVREYAWEKLEEEERALLRRRHCEYFLLMAEEAERHLNGPEQVAWCDRLEADHDNLRLALEECEGEARLQLAGALGRFWKRRGYWREGQDHLDRSLADTSEAMNGEAYARALERAADIAGFLGEPSKERRLLEECIGIARKTGAWRVLADALHSLAYKDFASDDKRAQAMLEESLALYREVGDMAGAADVLRSLGNFNRDWKADFTQAEEFYEESVVLCRKVGDQYVLANVLTDGGYLRLMQGQPRQAEPLLEEALALQRQMGHQQGLAHTLWVLGLVVSSWNLAAARAYLEESLTLRRDLGERTGISHSLDALAHVAREQGDYARARALFEDAYARNQGDGSPQISAILLLNLAEVSRCERDFVTARSYLEQCLAIRRQIGDNEGAAIALGRLGRVALAQEEAAEARRCYAEMLALLQDHTEHPGAAAGLAGLACAEEKEGRPERAARLLGASSSLRQFLSYHKDMPEFSLGEQSAVALRARLGEAAFSASWEWGHALPVEKVLAYALQAEPGD